MGEHIRLKSKAGEIGAYLAAPKGTPKDIIDRAHGEIAAALKEPQAAKVLSESQQMTMLFSAPADLATFLSREIKTWGAVVREHGIKASN